MAALQYRRAFIHIWTHTQTWLHIRCYTHLRHTHIHIHIHINTHTHIHRLLLYIYFKQTRTRTHTQPHTHNHTHTYIYTYIHTQIDEHRHAHTQRHTNTEQPLHRDSLTQTSFYRGAFTRETLSTFKQSNFDTRDPLIRNSFYTETRLHRTAFTHRFYTKQFLHIFFVPTGGGRSVPPAARTKKTEGGSQLWSVHPKTII